MASIVIPAHNEGQVLGRLLSQLVPADDSDEFDIIVVANGCTDNTVGVAASFGPPVRVLSIPVASKREALAVGNRVARGFPRLYVDADVELRHEDARALAEALNRPGILGVGPARKHDMTGRPWTVRWYYDVWTRLPEVQHGLFGRGVVGVNAVAYSRIAELPPLIADDLAASLAFSPAERRVVPGSQVVIHPPLTFADLLRVRTRAAMGVDQIEQIEDAPSSTARTRPRDLLAIAFHGPLLTPKIMLFLTIAALVRRNARIITAPGSHLLWLRDESSREEIAAVNTAGDIPASE